MFGAGGGGGAGLSKSLIDFGPQPDTGPNVWGTQKKTIRFAPSNGFQAGYKAGSCVICIHGVAKPTYQKQNNNPTSEKV